jgi:hypothetical protein
MKISTKQAHMLLDIAKGSLNIVAPLGGYSQEIRHQLINDVINQQSNQLTDTDKPYDDK